MSELETRQFAIEFREDEESGTFEGIAVPWGQTVNIGGKFSERFERGSIDPASQISIYRDHRELIGHVLEAEDREEGFWIRARVALTALGQDTLALLRSGALSKLSVGFIPVQDQRDGDVIVRSRVDLREVSVVERPAYSLANVLAVREELTEVQPDTPTKENQMSDQLTPSAADFEEVRGAVEDIERRMATLSTSRVEEPAVDGRSAAEFLVALSTGDAGSLSAYNRTQDAIYSETLTRAYTGGTTADAPLQNQWVGDITKLFDASSGILSETFSKGTLPNKGYTLEYSKEGTVTGAVTEQLTEGADLPFLKATLTTATATIHTYGGYTQFSFQEIERSTLPIIQHNLEWLAMAAAQNKKKVLREDYDAVVAARRAVAANAGVVLSGAAVGAMTPAQWMTAVIAGNRRFRAQGFTAEKILVTEDVAAALFALSTTGDRVVRIAEGNSAGNGSVSTLSGTIFGMPWEVDDSPSSAVATGQAVFVNSKAIKQYDSAVVSLQDSNVINLSKDYSVYRYGAVADERPSLIVPVKFAAS